MTPETKEFWDTHCQDCGHELLRYICVLGGGRFSIDGGRLWRRCVGTVVGARAEDECAYDYE